MARIRFRLRTLMIVVAFVALVLVVLLQDFYIGRAELRIFGLQADAESARAAAEMERVRAAQQLLATQQIIDAAETRMKRIIDKAKRAPAKDHAR